MYRVLILLLLIISISAFGDDDCKYFKYCGSNTQSSQSTRRSSPTVGSAGRANPSVISKIKGFGLETLYQQNNPLEFNIVTGNGKFGGMLTSSSGENSFFGNRTIELDDEYQTRFREGKRYKNKKLQLALGASLIEKKYLEFNLGVSGIHNGDTKKNNLGYAISGKFLFINFGYYQYNDDIKLDLTNHFDFRTGTLYTSIYGTNTYQETYKVTATTIGTKIFNFSIDGAVIISRYNFYTLPTQIRIISTSLALDNFMFNFAKRVETSDNMLYQNGSLVYSTIKNDMYAGVQYLPNQHLLLGVGYNNYLMKEFSFTMTLFL